MAAQPLRSELRSVLAILDRLEALAPPPPPPSPSDPNLGGQPEIVALKSELEEERRLGQDWQRQILALDGDKIGLRQELDWARDECGVLSKVLQKISQDHEELQNRLDTVMQVKK